MKKTMYLITLLISVVIIIPMSYGQSIQFVKIVDTQTSIPNGQGNFSNLSGPYIYGNNIVFRGYGQHGQKGVYMTRHRQLKMVANQNTKIPLGDGAFKSFGQPVAPQHNVFQYLAYNSPVIDNHQVAFLGTGTANQSGIYLYRHGKLHCVVNQASLIPNSDEHFIKFDAPYLNQGAIVFRAHGSNKSIGLYRYAQHKLMTLYDTQTSIPDSIGTFHDLWNPSFSDGYTAFVGKGQRQTGIYADISGHLKPIVTAQDKLPHTKNRFISFGGPSIQGRSMAFRGEAKNMHGIYLYTKGKLIRTVDLSSPIAQGNGTFMGVFNPTYAYGKVSFIGQGMQHQKGIYLWSHNQLYKILAVSDQLDHKKIRDLNLGAVSLSQHFIAFHVLFRNGSEGIYLAKI